MTTVKWLAVVLSVLGALTVGAGAILVPLAMLKFSMATLGLTGAGAFAMIGGALRAVTLALVGNPIGLALTAIATAATMIYANWDKLSAWWTGVLDRIIGRINRLRENLHIMMPGLFDAPTAMPTRASNTATISNSPILKAVAAGGGNSTYNISVATQPGADNVDLARQIRAEMDRMDRDKAARQRSQLRDRE